LDLEKYQEQKPHVQANFKRKCIKLTPVVQGIPNEKELPGWELVSEGSSLCMSHLDLGISFSILYETL
jgi:hypothetical protein